MSLTTTRAACALAAALSLTGCGTASSPSTTEAPMTTSPDDVSQSIASPTMSPSTTATPPLVVLPPGAPTSAPPGTEARPEVQAAIADLAERRGVDPSEVRVLGYADVTWPDGSLGCPEPGMAYTQALVPGRQLVLATGSEVASYHGGRTGDLGYCASPTPSTAGGTDPDV